jgi:glycosyltransferase involved in cell wall biosynthesis
MPNYNNEQWLDKSIGSVLSQTFKDFKFVFVDDSSADNSYEKAFEMLKSYENMLTTHRLKKLWNGGARNVGLKYFNGTKYTLFLDSDDWFVDVNVLQDLHDFIVDNDYPDCIRLPYLCRIGDKETPVILLDSNPSDLVRSAFVACWTKCIKSELVRPFPENTLMEDVVQHIKQCDKITTVEPFYRPVVVWNRNNRNSCSRAENQDLQRGKWQSSMYRYMADLLDLELTHDYCIAERDKRAKVCLGNIKADKYIQ